MDFSKLFPIQEQVESGGNPNAVSPKGAVGPMQTMRPTLSDPGYGVRPAQNDSVDEQRRVGQDYMKALYSHYGEDLPTALAAYNWGPGNVDKWKQRGAEFAKLPAETRDYITKISSRLGEAGVATARSVDNALSRKPSREEYDARITAGVQASLLRPEQFSRSVSQSRLDADAENRALQEQARPTGFEMFGASVSNNSMMRLARSVSDTLFAEKFPEVPGYKPDLKALPPNTDDDLLQAYATAKSPQEAEQALRKFEDEQFRNKTVGDRGALTGVALSLAAEGLAVHNYVAPFAVTKMLGTAAASTITGQIAENVLSGTAIEAITQGLEGKFRPQELAISVVADGLIGAGMGAWANRANSIARAERSLNRARDETIAKETAFAKAAEQELGPNASPADMRKVIDRMYIDEINAKTSQVGSVKRNLLDTDTTPEVAPTPRFDRVAEQASPGVPESSVFKGTTDRVVAVNEAAMHPDVKAAAQAVRDMAHLLPDGVRVAVGETASATVRGEVVTAGSEVRIAISSIGNAGGRGVETAMHEVTHAITDFYLPNATPQMRSALLSDFSKFLYKAKAGDAEAVLMRWADKYRSGKGKTELVNVNDPYEVDFGEWLSEQGARYFREDAAKANTTSFSKGIVDKMTEWLASVYRWFSGAKEAKHLPPEQSFTDFMRAVAAKEISPVTNPNATVAYSVRSNAAGVVNEVQLDPDAVRFGLNLAPMGTAAERAKAQTMLALHKKAEAWAVQNPKDAAWDKAADNLADNNVFNVASSGLLMLKSQNPLVRMIASELLEDASGVQKQRKATAAIAKWTTERLMLGNALNDVQGAYAFWKVGKPGGHLDDLVGGRRWQAFNRELAAEIEARGGNGQLTQDPNVKAAADSLEAAYQRAANEQRRVGTLGADALSLTSRGYMPHRMDAKAVLNLSNAKTQVLHQALVDQFITVSGWDISFSDMLASKYIARVKARAAGDYGSNIGGGNTSTASLVEEALRGMDLPEDTIKEHMDNYAKGAANFTKKRITLDLNKTYSTPDGDFKLLDIFQTDQIELLRAQVGRASGEVALTMFGVRGKPGLQLLRDALQYGADGAKAANPEREAFDQIAAEFLNEPVNPAAAPSKWMGRAMAANTLVRLGGIGFNQLAESINGVFHIGASGAISSIASIGRLRGEILDLVKGKAVNNPFLTSIEHSSGAEFGTDAYRVVMPFDSPNHAYPTYGQDTLTMTDRLLRGGTHAQAVLSGWRLIHSAQQRGMAEQIVKKIARYVNEGKDDIALNQMGIHPGLQAKIKANLGQIATFDASGNPTGFDVTKLTDPADQQELIQAVWRGTSQIIQGTFIGERGKWAHEGWAQLLTQFRTFSITSMEKQWGRQRNSHGTFAAYGMLIGSMSMAVPIYMARVYANSVGREDQEAYIEERLQPQHLARATLNYVAMSGMAGDFLDLTSSMAPDSFGIKPTGGRAGQESDFVGNYVAPAFSLVDDIWKYTQSPGNLDEAVKLLPGSRIPYLLPFVNATKSASE